MTTGKEALQDYEVKECLSISGTPDEDGSMPFFRVGESGFLSPDNTPVVTRITLQRDVHGEFCLRTRACVWVGEKLVFEAPYHALTGVVHADD